MNRGVEYLEGGRFIVSQPKAQCLMTYDWPGHGVKLSGDGLGRYPSSVTERERLVKPGRTQVSANKIGNAGLMTAGAKAGCSVVSAAANG